jgi:hypothetical protein
MRVLSVLIVASFAAATAGHVVIVRSFEPWLEPGGGKKIPAVGIEAAVGYLWTSNGGYVVRRHIRSGSVYDHYNFGDTSVGGLCSDSGYGPYCYFTDLKRGTHIRMFDPYTGSLAGSFPSPPMADCAGIAYDGTSLYVTDWKGGCLYKATTAGSVTATIDLPFDYPWGITYDKRAAGSPYIWCTTRWPNNSGDSYVYMLTTAGSVVDRAKWLFRGTGAAGITIDGFYLWVIHEGDPPAPENLAIQVKFISEPAVTPSSLGKVKALFR